MIVNICGIPHDVIEAEDSFDADCHLGMITYAEAVIKINKKLSGKNKKETICHEMVHGMLTHLGYNDLSNDEQFVQAIANAIMQGFEIIDMEVSEI